MRFILSPAKNMKVDTDSLPPLALPALLPQTQRLLRGLQALSHQQRQALWKCNDALAARNNQQVDTMDLSGQLTPALLSYVGIQYRYMAPGVFTRAELDYVQRHVRILSGFYGILRPFDGVVPYRLEMGTPFAVEGCKDLYAFWGDKLARFLADETDLVVNLASKEYSKAVEPHLPASVSVLKCTFGSLQGNRVVEKGTLCKMARGQMVRWAAEHGVDQATRLQDFSDLGYQYDPVRSTENHYVFLLKEDL